VPGLVHYVDLLAPDVLHYDLRVLRHALAPPHFFFGRRTLLHHDLFFGAGHPRLVLAYLRLGGLATPLAPA
jgi:hypothetical protein